MRNEDVAATSFEGSSSTTARIADNLNQGFSLADDVAARAYCAGLILRVRELLLRELDSRLGALNISNSRQHVLAIICRARDGLQIGEVAARASVHPTTMTSTIERLKRDGLIKRRAVTADRRATLIVATQKGRELYEQACDALVEIEFGMMQVPPDVVAVLNDGLDDVASVLEQRQTATR